MTKIKGTKTEINVLTAFAGESQARNRYTFFASAAKKEGYEQISRLFEETASQEKEHAERLFKFLEGGEATISASYPAGRIGKTMENLVEAANGEKYEYSDMYPSFAKVAQNEGFAEIAAAMRNIAVAEKHHEDRYLSMLKELQAGTLFHKPEQIVWECLNCGYLHIGTEAPKLCPACAHPQAYFARKRDSWR
ncbi:MAG: rubrerythrin family protein [Rickettsiales bacterium]|jgi:rubrerythrin|nr:rubrerythrin family protein [Rickettsiales bacterium]